MENLQILCLNGSNGSYPKGNIKSTLLHRNVHSTHSLSSPIKPCSSLQSDRDNPKP